MSRNIYEFIVLQQKDAHTNLQPLLADYDREARTVSGFLASRHFKSFHALPQPDTTPVYVMIYQWKEANTIQVARDYIVNTQALNNLIVSADISAFALTEQIEGDAIDVNSLGAEPGQVLEVAVRRIKADQEVAFDAQRRDFVSRLDAKPEVITSYELKAVMGDNPERLTVGLTVYRDQAAFQQLAAEIMADPATMPYFATFDAEALKYTQSL